VTGHRSASRWRPCTGYAAMQFFIIRYLLDPHGRGCALTKVAEADAFFEIQNFEREMERLHARAFPNPRTRPARLQQAGGPCSIWAMLHH
jgi:hypothetical protein